jgi:hypothetical protein
MRGKFFVFLVFIFFILPYFAFSQDEIRVQYKGRVAEGYIKFSTSFKNGFVLATPKKVYFVDFKGGIRQVFDVSSFSKTSFITSLSSTYKVSKYNFVVVGTSEGVLILNENFSLFRAITDKDGLKDKNITSLGVQGNYLYIGTKFWGFYIYDFSRNVLLSKPITAIDGIVDNSIRHIYLSPFDRVISTSEGISIYDFITYTYIGYDSTEFPVLSGTVNVTIAYGDVVFVGTTLGLFRFDRRAEKIYKTSFSSPVFSMEMYGNLLLIGSYEGFFIYDIEKDFYYSQGIAELSGKIISTVSLNSNYIFVGSDDKSGNYVLFSSDLPNVKVLNVEYPSKGNILVTVEEVNIDKIKGYQVLAESFNIGKTYDMKFKRSQKDGFSLFDLSLKELRDDLYIMNLSYFTSKGKFTSRDMFLVDNSPPSISFSPVPLFVNKSSLTIVAKLNTLDLKEAKVILNKDKVFVMDIDISSARISGDVQLNDGTNEILVVSSDNFGNFSTNRFVTILDTVSPVILSMDGDKIVERDGVFKVKVVERYIDRVVFSVRVTNLVERKQSDGVEYSFSIADRNVDKVKVVAYDLAGNSTSKDFSVVFSSVFADIVLPNLPDKVFDKKLAFDVRLDGKFSKVFVYKQGILVNAIDSPQDRFRVELELDSGINIVRFEGISLNGNLVQKSLKVEFVSKGQTFLATAQSPIVSDDIEKLKKENEELRRKIAELEEMIRKLSSGQKVVVYKEVEKDKDEINFPALIKVPYNPSIDNFMKISKSLYGSDAFSSYFYYILNGTSTPELVSKKGYVLVPNKELMKSLVRKGDKDLFSAVSAIVEFYISRELKVPMKKIGNVSISGNKVISGNEVVRFSFVSGAVAVEL